MATIDGELLVNGLPRNGATAALYAAGAAFTTSPPQENTPFPSGSALATTTTGIQHGAEGAYRFSGVSQGEYYVGLNWNGIIVWQYYYLPAAAQVSVKDFGAVGDGSTNDTTAIQACLNAAAVSGGVMLIPPGTYKVTSPLTVTWGASATPTRPGITGIEGFGARSVLEGFNIASGRAVLELLGESNTYAVNMYAKDFRILQDTSCSSGSYCLRVGDAKDGFLAERLQLDGANGIRLKIASSTSYAQLNTVFRQCSINTNYSHGWFAASTSGTFLYALFPESGGAYWDNVLFESCLFEGYCETRAHVCEFDNCQFSTDPGRGVAGDGRDYGQNVAIRLGNATFRSCYFEDHTTAILITPGLGDIHTVGIYDSHFSGVSNFAGQHCNWAIQTVDVGGRIPQSVRIENCEFGNDSYVSGSIQNAGGLAVDIINPVNHQTASGSVTITNTKSNFAIRPANTQTALRIQTLRFFGTITASGSVAFPAIEGVTGAVAMNRYLVNKPCWIASARVFFNTNLASGTVALKYLKNGSIITFSTYPTNFTTRVDTGFEQGYILHPASAPQYAVGDDISVQLLPSGYGPVPTQVFVELELAY